MSRALRRDKERTKQKRRIEIHRPAGPEGPQGPAGDSCTLTTTKAGDTVLTCSDTSITLPKDRTITICACTWHGWKTLDLTTQDFIADYYGKRWYFVGACEGSAK